MSDLPDDVRRWPSDPFKLLGVPRNVPPRDLKRAYTRLIRSYKPEHSPDEFRRIRAAHIGPDKGDPYVVMGVAFDAGDDEVKATYRMLVRENHPDKLIARGVPEEFIRLATDKLAVINAAYDKIEQERGWKKG